MNGKVSQNAFLCNNYPNLENEEMSQETYDV